jgi:hypothetical protein
MPDEEFEIQQAKLDDREAQLAVAITGLRRKINEKDLTEAHNRLQAAIDSFIASGEAAAKRTQGLLDALYRAMAAKRARRARSRGSTSDLAHYPFSDLLRFLWALLSDNQLLRLWLPNEFF